MKLITGKKGFTLVELIVVTALLVVVIGAAASLYYFGSRTFSESEGQAEIQRNLRLVQKCILDELRNSTGVGIYNIGAVLPEGKRGITLSAAGSEFNCIFYNSSKVLESAPNISPVSEVALAFSSKSGGVLLTYRITAVSGSQDYELTGDVLLNNVLAAALENITLGTEYKLTEHSLYYIKP